ncbi:ATP-binding protein [Geomonas sp. Red276]
MSLMISAFLFALSRSQRLQGPSSSFALLALAYALSGLRLGCQLLVIGGLPLFTVPGDLFYTAFICSFWLGVRTYADPAPIDRRLWAIPLLLALWSLLARASGVEMPWVVFPLHLVGTAVFVVSGALLWSLYRVKHNAGHLILTVMMVAQGLSTASYPFTRTTWYAPYGFALFSLLASAIGMGFIISTLLDEQLILMAEIEGRKLAEAAHRKSLAMLEAITANSPTGIALFEGESGACEIANRSLGEIMGVGIAEMLGKDFRELESWRGAGLDRVAEETLADGKTRHQQVTLASPQGARVTIEYFILSLSLDGERHLLFVATDLSERKRLEHQLAHSQKMESVGRLAGGVAHDFNNMLTVILGCAHLLGARVPDEEPLHQYIASIRHAAERSSEITRQLLAFSRNEIIEPRPVNLNLLITESAKSLTRLIGEDITVSLKLDPYLCKVNLDPSQAYQILINLAVNARDAMPDGGCLIIETANADIENEYAQRHADAAPGGYVRLTVSDTGTGIDREIMEHIFEPFFTTKAVGQGTGLGLSTVYGIVTQNRGFINVYSEPGEGTAFTIHIPRLAVEVAERERASVEVAAGTGTILIVEDEEPMRVVTTQLLEECGYRVIPCGSGQEAVGICQESGHLDLILSDVVMPGMNGKEMAERIRGIRPELKVLFMSGYTANLVAQRGIVEEGTFFIQKPFNIHQLHRKIHEVLAARADSPAPAA